MGIALTGSAAALERLFARTTGAARLGLERTSALLDALGNPQRTFAAIHVAGTNGKGSTVAAIDALLRAPDRRVGRYTSPHLVDFRERILIDGRPIRDEGVVEFLARWMPEIERTGATFFEATTAMAFHWFARERVDIAVIETGLGGRLDATNVIQPLVAAVTSVGIDHVEFLGTTIEAIAGEKAGIFKAGVPAMIGESDPGTRGLLRTLAVRAGAAPVEALDDEWVISEARVMTTGTRFALKHAGRTERFTVALAGHHQARNAALAIATVRAAGEAWQPPVEVMAARLDALRLPGRFHREGKFIFDVAHNPDGAAVLARTLTAVAPASPIVAVLTVLRDKDWLGIMRALSGVVDGFILTAAPTAPASRSWDPGVAGAAARAEGWRAEVVPDFDEALQVAAARAATVLVTGSFHTVGDAMARLRVSPFDG